MGYNDISDRSAVLSAIDEHDQIGKDQFLLKYGYRDARGFFLKFKGREYPSKAILGVAHKYQFGKPLRWDDFSGGRNTVQPVLESLGFKIEERNSAPKDVAVDKDGGSKAESKGDWSEAELRESVVAYLDMQRRSRSGEKYSKKSYYSKLAKRFGRSEKAFEFRMQNISYVLGLMGRTWLEGLKPAKNVGRKNALVIERLVQELEELSGPGVVSFELDAQDAKKNKKRPMGNKKPKSGSVLVTQYVRDAKVKGWVLANAKGKCECCGSRAPFESVLGPFLEVHHVHRLCDGGADTVENALALCPNCHRMLHFSINATEIVEKMYAKHSRLVRAGA